MPTEHRVKSWPYLFQASIDGRKKADFRHLSERPYRAGDILILEEYDQALGEYTGRSAMFDITHVISRETPCAMSSTALDRDACVLSIELITGSITDYIS